MVRRHSALCRARYLFTERSVLMKNATTAWFIDKCHPLPT